MSLMGKFGEQVEKRSNNKNLIKIFENQATCFNFIDIKSNKLHFLFAIKDATKKTMLVRNKDKLYCNITLKADGQEFIITDIDNATVPFFDESIPNTKLDCFLIHYAYGYEVKKETPSQHTTNYYQTVNNSGIMGDVNQQIVCIDSELKHLEDIINNTHTSLLLHKGKKQRIQVMIGQFKNCIQNKQEDETFFAKLKNAIKDFAPAALIVIEKIISAVFPH